MRPEDPRQDDSLGRLDLTRWPTALRRWLVRLAVALGRLASANSLFVVSAVIGAMLVSALTVASGEVYEAVEDGDGIATFDRPALDASIAWRTATNVKVATAFTDLGGPIPMTIIASLATIAMAVGWRSKTPLTLMVIGVAGSLTMTSVGKQLVGRVRPPRIDAVAPFESSPSFPSGHTLNSTVIAGLIAYLVLRRLHSVWVRVLTVVLAVGWAVSMGFSRVFLGHHWLTDVAVGWTLGLAWVGLVITAHRVFLTVRRSQHWPC